LKLATVFMGTPEIAVPALRLLAARTDLRLVVTQPDRPAGRGNHLKPPEVKLAALELGLPVWQPETLKGQAGDPRLAGLDLAVVMAYGELLRQDLLDRPRLGCINLHASLLPRWRGASPLQAVLRAGDAASGVTVMRMVRALDAGPVFLREQLALPGDATLGWLHGQLAAAAARALGRLLDRLDAGALGEPEAQDEALATHCRKLTAEDGLLDFARPAAELERWVRAYTPAPGCWTRFAGERVRILALAPAAHPGLEPGALAVDGRRLLVGCGDGALEVLRLQPPGRPPLDAAAWLNGHRPPPRVG
jgi:methionyl-tRNA formyltransferase